MTVNFFLRDSKAKKVTSIGAYYYLKRKRYHIATGLRIPPDRWDVDKQRAKTGRSFQPGIAINTRLERIKEDLENAYYEGLAEMALMDRTYFLSVLSRNSKQTNFFDTAERFLAHLLKEDRIRYRANVSVQVGKLKNFLQQDFPQYVDNLPLQRITVLMLHGYVNFIRTDLNNSPNTVKTSIKRLKRIYTKALSELENQDDLRTKLTANNPFNLMDEVQGQKSSKIKLTQEEIEVLEGLTYKADTFENHAVKVWLFSFYTGGIRAGDVLMLRKENFDLDANRYYYLVGKTKQSDGRLHSMILIPPARKIIDHYIKGKEDGDLVFPFIKKWPQTEKERVQRVDSASTKWRKCLKKVALEAGIRYPSPHIARHTFADLARSKKADPHGIKMALRHSSIQITEKYMKDFDTSNIDDAILKTFGYDKG